MNRIDLITFKFWLRWDYERNKINILLGAWTCVLAHPAYYFVCTELLDGYKDSAIFRFGSALISLPLLFQSKVPEKGLAWLNLYWYGWITFILPVSFTYILLLNDFAPMWVVCQTMMLALTIIFIGNFMRIVMVIAAGTFIGYCCFQWSTGQSVSLTQIVVSKTYPLWNLLVPVPIIIWCGVMFIFGAKQALIAIEKTEAIKAFAGSIAHEMRNALTQIKYALNSIYANLPAPDNEAQDISIPARHSPAFFNNINQGLNACQHGLQVINLSLNQVNNHTPEPESFQYVSAAAITSRALSEYGFKSDEERAKVSIHIQKDFIINVDETAYIYIIFNLLKNAIYYFRTLPDALINITVDAPKITLMDTGPGISAEIRGRLFKPFSTAGKINGSGLGLSYCSRMMQAFKGDIRCESKENQYTTFTLTFPQVTTKAISQWTKKMTADVNQFFIHHRILLVDDEAIYLKVLRHLLMFLNCDIDTASSGQEALDLLAQKNYDLIFMDLQMPDKDGYVTCREIRSGVVPAQKNICIIAHTNEPPGIAKLKTEKIGMDGFLSKPATQVELIREIKRAQELAARRAFLDQAGDILNGKKVLIVDDEFFNRRILGVYAKQWHMQILEADSGETALQMLEQEPDTEIVFMDINMPGMDGIEATRKIRANPRLKDIIIIGISGEFSEQALATIKAAGMDDSIVKPAEPDVLKKKLLQQVQAKSKTRPTSSRQRRSPAARASHQTTPPVSTEDSLIERAEVDGKLPFTTHQISRINEMKLLDDERLTSYQVTFKEEFGSFLEEMISNVQKRDEQLQAAFASKNYQSVYGTLHSLIGISGYAGAYALNQYIKLQVYPRITEKNYDAEAHWVSTIHRLVEQSIAAMRKQWLR